MREGIRVGKQRGRTEKNGEERLGEREEKMRGKGWRWDLPQLIFFSFFFFCSIVFGNQ